MSANQTAENTVGKVTTITENQDCVVLVNVFDVLPENQQKLLDKLIEVTKTVMVKVPGFISANFHKSLDGKRIVNYAQWKSVEHFQAMIRDPVSGSHIKECGALALKVDPTLLTVAYVHNNAQPQQQQQQQQQQ